MNQEQTGAVIVGVRGRKATALTRQGEYVRVKDAGYSIGQEVLLVLQHASARPARRRMRLTAYAGMAAGFLLLFLGGFKGYTVPVGVVSLDVNPSIEYSINAFDRVLDISAVNADAGLILAGIDKDALRYHPVDEAVDATILVLLEKGYLSDAAQNDVVISTSSYDTRHTARIAERLGLRVGLHGDLIVYSVSVSQSEVEYAHARGASAGKLYIIEELEASWSAAEPFDADDWMERSVREILYETNCQREGKYDDDEDREWSSSMPAGTSTDQQSDDASEHPEYQQDEFSEHEPENDESPEEGESNFD